MTNDALERDRACLWHPTTHFIDNERLPPRFIERAEGVWLHDVDGARILDAISSWWTCIHGHAHPRIVDAIAAQARKLDHVMFAGFTHAPAIELAERLLAVAPSGFGKVFFADCGSAAVEVAMKMSFQARQQTQQPQRRRFATLQNGYHGETLGALAMCGSELYREPFSSLLVDPVSLPVPAFPDHEHSDAFHEPDRDCEQTQAALALLERHAHELTAVLVEPLVQCAGKMRFTGVRHLRRICETAQALGIHVIADEIAVGFGRTGRLFASEWSGTHPDFMCLSKGLSGGTLPLACVLIREGFERHFAASPSHSFLHSHTFTANPVACAAAVASLDVFASERIIERLPPKIEHLAVARHQVASACASVRHHRQIGMIAAFELEAGANKPAPADGRLGLALRSEGLARGVLLRPLHDTLYWMPPLCIETDEIDVLARATIDTINAVLA